METKKNKIYVRKEKKGINIAALIVCFVVACGIWLYAQAIDDAIRVQTYNQIPVEFVGGEAFREATGYDVHSLGIQNANVSVSGTNRELAKFDAQSIRLVADVSAVNNGVVTVKAYYEDEEGNRTEIKNYEISHAVTTVNVAKQVNYSVMDVTEDRNENEFSYKIEQSSLSGTFTVIGPVQDIVSIGYATFELDYKNVMATPGTHTVSVSSIAFYGSEDEPLFGEGNKNDNLKYDTTGIMVSVTVESRTADTDGK